MKLSSNGFNHHSPEGEIDCLNSELWHACAGPLVSLPTIGSHVVYFPQGHSEQVAVSTNKEVDSQTPNYPSLPPQLICQLHNATMHADVETDEVYAQMTLQPLTPQKQEVSFLPADLGAPNKQPTNYFCKTLTASDTSTHGGFSVPRRAAEKVFPPLDFSLQPPVQELIARDLHNNEWKFRHIFRGQPKRHLLTTGWSVFVSAKRLVAGDSVLFIWNDKNQLFVGTRRANRSQTVMPSSFLSSDSMHLGLLAAAAHAAATNSRFTIFYNPRASPSEFVIPLAKYVKAAYHTRVSVGMRFRMLFETEESSVRRYMGTITGISDLDSAKWPNSHWRSVKVGWDESTAGKRQPRVSLWEIEPLTTFPMYPTAFPLRLKRPWPQDIPSFMGMGNENMGFNSPLMYPRGDVGMQSFNFQGMGVTPWMQQRFDNSVMGMQSDMYQAMAAAALQEMRVIDPSKHVLSQLMQLQQPQDLSNFVQPQMSQQAHSPAPYNQTSPISQPQAPAQSHSNPFMQQLRNQNSFNNSQYGSSGLPVPSQLSSNSQADSSSRQNFVESNIKPVLNDVNSPFRGLLGSVTQEETSNLVNVSRPNNLSSSNGWPTKRVALDPLLSNNQNQVRELNTNVTQIPVSLPPFPDGERLMEQEGSNDAQNNYLFGVNIDNSCGFVQNGMPNFSGVGNESKNNFASTNYMSGSGADYSRNLPVISNGFADEQGFVQTENGTHAHPPNRNFVKVHKSGSFGRSLDLSMFSSYQELRSELAHMFGLEGQLEDPLRSGWQLVFVDRENDILLLGDDPWQEFVNSVWCIKILSPQEVQEMGKRGLELLNSVHKLPLLPNEGYDGRQVPGNNMNPGIPSVGWDS